jgi:hypothetical protein
MAAANGGSQWRQTAAISFGDVYREHAYRGRAYPGICLSGICLSGICLSRNLLIPDMADLLAFPAWTASRRVFCMHCCVALSGIDLCTGCVLSLRRARQQLKKKIRNGHGSRSPLAHRRGIVRSRRARLLDDQTRGRIDARSPSTRGRCSLTPIVGDTRRRQPTSSANGVLRPPSLPGSALARVQFGLHNLGLANFLDRGNILLRAIGVRLA